MPGLDDGGSMRNLLLLMCHLDALPAGKLGVVSISMCSSNRIAGAERRLHHLALIVVGGKVLAGEPAGVQVKHLQISNAGVNLPHAQVSIVTEDGLFSKPGVAVHQMLKQAVAEKEQQPAPGFTQRNVNQAQLAVRLWQHEGSCNTAIACTNML